jgi:hypothetical protein
MSTQKIGNVPVEKLTHRFAFAGKECLIGKFDLDDAATDLSDKEFSQLGTEILFQIDASGVFNMNEMETIAMMDSESFLNCITEI